MTAHALTQKRTIAGFISARSTAILGDQIITFFVPVAVFGATQNVQASGIAFLVQWLPRIVSMPISGAFVDRFPARRQLVIVDLLRAAVFVAAAATGSIPFLVVASGAATLLNGHSTIAVESILGREVPADRYAPTQAKFQAAQQLVTVGGPAIGGVLLVTTSVPIGLLVIAAVFLTSGVWTGLAFKTLRGSGRVGTSTAAESLARRLSGGFSTVFTSPTILALIVLTLGVNLTGSLALASLPAIVIGEMQSTESMVAVLACSATVLSLLAALAVNFASERYGIEKLVLPVAVILTGSAVCMVLARDVVTMGAGYGLWSAGVTAFAVWMRTWRVRVIPSERLGAALGVFVSMIMVSAPLAGVVLATAGEALGAQTSLGVTSVVSVALVVPAYLLFRARTRMDSNATLESTDVDEAVSG